MKISTSTKISSIFQTPEHGSKISWAFYSGLKISVSVGLLGAVGVILVRQAKHYIDFIPFDQDVVSAASWAVPGLGNLGNNCFLNVVLQVRLFIMLCGDDILNAVAEFCRAIILKTRALASCSSFRKYLRKMVEEYGSLSDEEGDENIPLVTSLTSLVEDLCTIRHKRTVLSPRRLMIAMDHYIPNFNLTSQQDAEEAFSHLLSSLREEISEHCVPNRSYLADLPGLPDGRIIIRRSEEENEWQRWSRIFLKPFDGILGSFLVCQSCSFQISLDFQLFPSLHLSPPIGSDATIKAGCSLEDCLKKFFAVEHVENYCCSSCWHAAAIDYVSSVSEDKTNIEMLQHCNRNDSCECKALPSLKAFPWSNRFSRTFKQLSIVRSPKILCIHLQRASYNLFGQSLKLSGHVSFPLILDLSSFMNSGVGIKNMEANLQFEPLNCSSKEIRPFPYSKYQSVLFDTGIRSCKASLTASDSSIPGVLEEQVRNTIIVENSTCLKASEAAPGFLDSRRRADGVADLIFPSAPLKHQKYRLVSVVEHFGTSGSGHYTVYRKVTARLGEEPVALLESAVEQWFCISDAEVHTVSEKDVLDANASMLFYEKIDNS